MKKIFLTSGLVLCMACPAMAGVGEALNTADGSCIQNNLGTATDGANVNIEATWAPRAFTITYKPGTAGTRTVNSGTATVRNVNFDGVVYTDATGGDLKTLADDEFSISGYHFVKWTSDHNVTSGDLVSTDYQANTAINPYKVVGNTEMTAIWAPDTYTVTYEYGKHASNGTDGAVAYTDTDGAEYDASYTVPTEANAAITAAYGYRFQGWNTSNNQTESNFPDTEATPWTRLAGLTVYAAYSPITTTVSYDCGASRATTPVAGSWTNPSGWTGASQTVTFDEPASHPTGSAVCSLTGYTFNHWNCVVGTTSSTTNGIENDGISNGNWAVDATDVICTAVWDYNNINLTWYSDNGSGGAAGTVIDTEGTAAASCDYDGSITLPTTPDNPGYTFTGWKVKNVGTTRQ